MNQSGPEDNPAGGSRPQPAVPPPPIRYDLAAMLKENAWFCRVSQIIRADTDYLRLELMARAAFHFGFSIYVHIDCVEAVDYSIRPPSPSLLGGAPLMEFHEQHPRLEAISQIVPNTDGMETYDPPVKFGLLQIDQSYVIAGQFALRLETAHLLNNMSGLDDQQRQQRVASLQRGLDWMEPFRLPGLKRFTRRTFLSGE
jgi:hypothetical protein